MKRFVSVAFYDPTLYVSIVMGGISAIWAYSFWLSNLISIWSKRLLGASIIFFLISSVAIFFILSKLIKPYLRRVSCKTKVWLLISCLVIGTSLFFSTIDSRLLSRSYIFFLLPDQSLQVFAERGESDSAGRVTVQYITTSVEDLSFNSMDITGWQRSKEDPGQLTLTESSNNHISWTGKTGASAKIVLLTSPSGGIVDITWNGISNRYDLYSPTVGSKIISQKFPVPLYAGWQLVGFITALGYSYLLGVFFILLLNIKPRKIPGGTNKYDWIFYAAPMTVVWGLFLLVNFPGGMSQDSFTQWREMTSGFLIDWHPPLLTMIYWILTRVWLSPAPIIIIQILGLSGVLGWGLSVLRRYGLPGWLSWLTAAFLAILPSTTVLANMLWKDIPFSIAVTSLTIMIFQIVMSKGAWLNKKQNVVLLGLSLALVSLFRLNGIVTSASALIALAAAYSRSWKKIFFAAGFFLLLFSGVKWGLYPALQVKPNQMARTQLVMYNLAAAHLNNGTEFNRQEMDLVAGAFPKEKVPYLCYRNWSLIDNVDRPYLIKNTMPLYNLAVDLTSKAPLVTVNHFACMGGFVYRMFDYNGEGFGSSLVVIPNEFGIKTISQIPYLLPLSTKWINSSARYPDIYWWVWRSAFWMFLLVTGCVGSCFRVNSWKNLIILVPGLMVVLPLIFLSMGQIFRYTFAMYLIGILFSGYYWIVAAGGKTDYSSLTYEK